MGFMNKSGNASSESRWARKDEIMNASTRVNLNSSSYPTAGLPVYAEGNDVYVDGQDRHTMIYGSTGSKKTRIFGLPMINMMIKAGESYIVTDPKGEIFHSTSGMAKAEGYDLVVLNYRDLGMGDCWNPLETPYDLYHNGNKDLAMSMINDFITSISDDSRKNTKDLFWIEMASALALANMLLLMETGKKEEVTLGNFANLCTSASVERLKYISNYISTNTIAGVNYKSVLSSADNTLRSIQVSLYAWVRIFVTQKKLTAMLSKNTFDTSAFGRKKTGVYIIVPDEKTTYHFIVTTFIKQVYETLIGEAQKEKDGRLPVRVNFVLDEFCNIPAIPDMPSMISAARSRNMRYFLFVQGMHQLNAKYGDDAETIKGNCENWIFLTSRELVLLEEMSNLCGSVTTGSGEKRKLISVSELQRLRKERGEVLVLFGRQYPFITELPDIGDYKMFEGHPSAELPENTETQHKAFSLDELYDNVVKGGLILFKDELGISDGQDEEASDSDYGIQGQINRLRSKKPDNE